MKKVIAILLALMLPVCAAAETLREQVNAPEHIIGEFYSNSGHTAVFVDANIVIPSEDACHRWEVHSRVFTTEEVRQAADLFIGEGQWQFEKTGTTELHFHCNNLQSKHPTYACDVNSLEMTGLSPQKYLFAMYSVVDILGHDYHHYNALWIEDRVGNTSRQVGAVEDARAKADPIIQALWPDMAFSSVDPELKNLSGRTPDKYGYRLYYSRMVEGIPVTSVYMSGAGDAHDASYIPPLHYERLYVDVGADGIFYISYAYPIEIAGLLEENVSLLPFDRIWEVFGSIAPMTIAYLEANENNALYIDRIELGYMCVQMKDDPARYQLLPVWDFFGRRTMGEDTFSEHNYPYVTINAIDGTVIDRSYGY